MDTEPAVRPPPLQKQDEVVAPEVEKETLHKANIEQLRVFVTQLSELVKKIKSRSEYDEEGPNVIKAAQGGRELLTSFLKELGIYSDRAERAMLQADERAVYDSHTDDIQLSGQYALANMEQMLKIEEKKPGAVRYLYDQQGIRNFARFSPTFWLRQYAERDKRLPYMLTVLPAHLDLEIAPATSVYTRLQNHLQKLPSPHLMRVVEISSTPEGLRTLSRLDTKYNAENKNPIKLLLYDGHGLSHRILLGETGFGNEQMNDPRFNEIFKKYLQRAFTPDAQFIIASCNAAERERGFDGLAYTLKSVLQRILSPRIRVVASTESVTQFASLTPQLDQGGALSLESTSRAYGGEYGDKVPRYKNL